MTDAFKQQIQAEARQAVEELLEQAKLKKGDVFVVGCSSSEIVGGHIGKDSSLEAAQAVYAGIAPVLAQRGIWLAAQCCEHLNRAIIMEREAAEQYGWEEVCVVPRPHAGGSWATTCWKQCKDPIAVEEIRAHAGANAVKIPIIGMGGISSWQDAIEMMMAGATALQIGTVLFTDPYAPIKIADGMNEWLDKNGIKSVSEITGTVKPW